MIHDRSIYLSIYLQAHSQEFLRAGEVSENKGKNYNFCLAIQLYVDITVGLFPGPLQWASLTVIMITLIKSSCLCHCDWLKKKIAFYPFLKAQKYIPDIL